MRIVRHYANCPDEAQHAVVAIGNFDGVHLGHKAVILAAKEKAVAQQLPCAVLTFEPHPVKILRPEVKPLRVISFREKMQLLAALGVDIVYLLRFSPALAMLPANQFVEQVLINALKVKAVVVGHDFIFGHNRSGNTALLREWMREEGGEVMEVPAVTLETEICSSTRIRHYLQEGKVEKASLLLGRSYAISGKVRKGAQLGRTLGFPTANISLKALCRPAFGVYAVLAEVEGEAEIYEGVANIGHRPTVDGVLECLEVHLFETARDLYGKRLHVRLIGFIRPEEKFPSLESLKKQIEEDCRKARILLGHVKERVSPMKKHQAT